MKITDEMVKKAAVEFLSYRGERPFRVTRRGAELWEDYAEAMRFSLTAALSASPAVGVKALVQTHVVALEQLREQIGSAYDAGEVRLIALSEWCEIIDAASALTALREENERLENLCMVLEAEKNDAEARATAAEARLAEAMKVIVKQDAALSVLSDAVFNDNGGITVNIPTVTYEHCVAAYFSERAARAFIEKENSNG